MNPLFTSFMEMLAKTERLPLPELARYQEGLLERLVRHACEQTTFYRDRLRCLLRPDGSIDLSRWNEVPILTRDDVIANYDGMRAARLDDGYGEVSEVRTSGSTGIPLRIARNEMVPFVINAFITRTAHWFGMETSRPLAAISRFATDDHAPYPEGRADKGWSLADPEAPHYSLGIGTPIPQQLEWLSRRKAPYLLTNPSNALELARALTPAQSRALGIEMILSGAETIPDGAREFVAERFGARMAGLYGCQEIGMVATECPAASHYHVAAENTLVEIIRDDGNDVAPGEHGRVVLTGFYNYAMPFIRYAIGDVAVAGTGACACGRSAAVIAQVEGRTRNVFTFRDGTRVWPRARLIRQMRDFVPFVQFQLVQLDHERIELRYVPDGSGREPDLEGLTAFARQTLNPSVTMIAVAMEALPRGRNGKFENIVSMISTSVPAEAR